LSGRRKGMKASSDPRILGGSEFVEDLLSEVCEREKDTLRLSVPIRDLRLVAKEIGKGERLEERDLRSGRRQRKISRGRRLFCQLVVGKMGYPGAKAARFLGVTTSAVVRATYSEELPEFAKYLQVHSERMSPISQLTKLNLLLSDCYEEDFAKLATEERIRLGKASEEEREMEIPF
jgi:hypothetical protein